MSDITLSRSDLFLVLFAAITLAHMVSAIVRATVTSYLMHRSEGRIRDAMTSGKQMMENLAAARDTLAQAERADTFAGLQREIASGQRRTSRCEVCGAHPQYDCDHDRAKRRGAPTVYDRDTLDDVRVIQEGAFLAGWRSAEQCRSLKPESEEHALHHFRWRDVAGITEQCTRAGAGACNHLHPSGNICSRPPGHDGKHSHGVLYWTDAESEIGSMLTPGGQ